MTFLCISFSKGSSQYICSVALRSDCGEQSCLSNGLQFGSSSQPDINPIALVGLFFFSLPLNKIPSKSGWEKIIPAFSQSARGMSRPHYL